MIFKCNALKNNVFIDILQFKYGCHHHHFKLSNKIIIIII